MTIAELSLLAAVVLWLATIGFAKAAGWREFDNAQPRAPAFYDIGWRRRALGAHQNGMEALPFFTAAVLLAEFRGAPQGLIDTLSGAFVAARLAYVCAYIGDRPSLRSLLWTIAFAINLALFLTPLARR